MQSFLSVARKEFQQLRRDVKLLRMMVISPIIQLLMFGYAASNDVTHMPLVVVDRDHTSQSRDLVSKFSSSGYFELAGQENSMDRIEPWIVKGTAQAALVIGADYGKELLAGRTAVVQYIVDGSDSATANTGLGYAARIVQGVGAELMEERLNPGRLKNIGRIEMVPRVWYNPDLKSRWFYIPAILAMILLMTTMILPSMAIVREKEIGTLEQIIVTPLKPWQLILGKLWPFVIIGLINMFFTTLLVIFWFGVPLKGSVFLLFLFTIPFLLSTLALGLFFSTLVRTQQQAMMVSVYVGMVPMIYLSGLMFPIENMPLLIQKVTYLVPLRYYAIILRGIFLKGSGFLTLWPQAAMLLVIGTTLFALASLRFHKTLD